MTSCPQAKHHETRYTLTPKHAHQEQES